MASTTAAVSVTSSATVLIAQNFERIGLILENLGTQVVYWGTDSSDTTASGLTLQPAERRVFDFEGGSPQYFFSDGLWGIVASGTADVRVMELVRTRSAAT